MNSDLTILSKGQESCCQMQSQASKRVCSLHRPPCTIRHWLQRPRTGGRDAPVRTRRSDRTDTSKHTLGFNTLICLLESTDPF